MKATICFILSGLVSLIVTAQYNSDTSFSDPKAYLKSIRSSYSDKYIINSDIGDITFLDQGHPDNRQYVLNSNIILYYAVTSKYSPVYFVINPLIRVRIFLNQPSLPIRTPSFQPGFTLFFNPFTANFQHYQYFSAGLYHHSNGQDGVALNPKGSLNLKNGNFSTTFLNLNFYKGHYENDINSYYKLGLELHSGIFKFGDDEKLRSKFGKVRLTGQIAISKYKTSKNHKDAGILPDIVLKIIKAKFLIDGMLVLNKIDATWNQHFNLEFKFYYNPFELENSSFFASLGYMGHDNYNIYFNQPYPFVRIGLAAGLPLKTIIEKAK